MKRGFTIVELLVVVAIIGILLGIVGMAATSATKTARQNRALAMAAAFGHAIAAYYSQKGQWPEAIEKLATSSSQPSGANNDDVSRITIDDEAANEVFQEVVKMSIGKNATMPLIDASALFVARASAVKGKRCNDNHNNKRKDDYCGDRDCPHGMDFTTAVKKGMQVEDMAFGWRGKEFGRFRRFDMKYNVKTDSVSVEVPDSRR